MIPDNIRNQFVRLSKQFECPNCHEGVQFIGELRENGNWYCPNCEDNIPGDFDVDVPYIKYDSIPKKSSLGPLGGILMGSGTPSFPMDIATSFLVPSYSYKIVRKRRLLIETTEDFTRTGRVKSSPKWAFELTFNNITKAEFDALVAFWEQQSYHLSFFYTDPFKGSTHLCYFDSEVSTETSSFNEVSCSVRITE